MNSSAHYANTLRLEALLLAHRLRVSGDRRPPPTIWGRACHCVAESRGVCGDLGRIWLLLQSLADDWQAGQSPTVKVQGSKPTPRGQAGPKTARGTPQNKAMVRPNPINRAQSTQRYPGRSRHAHWLGFSGVAQPAGIVGCGFCWRRGLGMPNHNVRISSPCYSTYHIPGSRSRGEHRAECTPPRGNERPLLVRLCRTPRISGCLDAADWLIRRCCRPEAAGLTGRSGGMDRSAEGRVQKGPGKHSGRAHAQLCRILRMRDRGTGACCPTVATSDQREAPKMLLSMTGG